METKLPILAVDDGSQQKQTKICSKCKIEKNIQEFWKMKRPNNKIGLAYRCKTCIREYNKTYHQSSSYKQIKKRSDKKYRQDIARQLHKSARQRAKKKNRVFDLLIEDIKIPEYCPILGLKLEISNDRFSANSYSLDRIDSKKGYTKDNIHVISYRANEVKKDANLQEIKKIIEWLEKRTIKSE